jgi:repressor LexA
VHVHLANLEKLGLLRRDPSKPRAIELLDRATRGMKAAVSGPGLPLVGQVAAGSPVVAEELVEDHVQVPEEAGGGKGEFILRIRGDSMVNAGILNGDTVVIQRSEDAHSGDIVVALVDNTEATLKRLRKRGSQIALEAANPAYETRIFNSDRVKVQGRLVGLFRRY